jgi:uncharacterized protein (DUF2235 family)
MPRNLVICCDGTNNSLTGPPTNVCHLAQLATLKLPDGKKDEAQQAVHYDAGVGVEADPAMYTRIGAALSKWSGSAFGTGLVDNVQQAYEFLSKNYADGDRIFMFGFLRGAYTVRVLAGLLQNYGLLRSENVGEARRVVKAFQRIFPPNRQGVVNGAPTAEQRKRFDEASEIKSTKSVVCLIHFMGVFDTVSSLGWAWDPKSFPNTRRMPNVKILRHAMALDERRAKFRTNRIELTQNADHRQVWFAGVHSDVGGGYDGDNKLARIPLRWMLGEAHKAGMLVDGDKEKSLALDQSWMQDEQAEQHESLTTMWRLLEYVPMPHWQKNAKGEWQEGRRLYRCEGWREISDTFDAHESLRRRKKPVKNVFWPAALPNINYGN